MLNISSIRRTATSLAIAALIGQPLAGCNAGASQFNPAAASTQPNIAQNNAATNADHVTHNIQPLAEDINAGGAGSGGRNCPPPGQWVAWYTYVVTSSGQIVSQKLKGYVCDEPCEGMTSSNQYTYVGLTNETVDVLKYAKGQLNQVATLTGLSGNPVGMATDSHGDLWVTNSPTTTISEFAKGATTPTVSYTDSNLNSVNYLAIDENNNVYVEGYSGSAMEIDELTASGIFTAIAKPGQVGTTPGGLAVQQHGKTTYMWVNDQGSGSGTGRISRYLLTPGSLKSTGGFTYSGIDGAIAVDPSFTDVVFAANNVPDGSQFDASIVEYDLKTGKVVFSNAMGTLPNEDVALTIAKKP
jgi:sugar lactone lactonase YvrE